MSLAKFPLSAGILYRGLTTVTVTARDAGLQCPNCNSFDLKKVSLVYQDGLQRVKTRSRLVGLLFGEAGPAIVTGISVQHGIQQTDLSKSLNPPVKWSYLRLLVWSFLATAAALFAYVIFASASAPPVSTLPVKLYVFLAPVAFVLLVAVFWRHNHLVYPRRYTEWDRCFLCQRCGTVSQHGRS